jgi:hypothetical protein
MKTTKLLLGSAAVVALALGYSSDAKAFDDVDWNWNKEVTSVENITINVDDQFDISGMVEVEKIQMNIGDVTATSVVSGVDNNPPGVGQDGTVVIDEVFNFQTGYDDQADPDGIDPAGPVAGVVLDGEILGGAVDEGGDTIDITFAVTGEVEIEALEGVNDAVDLPSVESVATAVGNNQSLDSTVAVNLHDAQYNMGDVGLGDNRLPPIPGTASTASVAGLDGSGNTHTDILAIASIGAALNVIQQGSVSALSDVSDITNASVDSSATAVGNNLSIDLQANTEGDAFMVADLTQFNYADVSANSMVSGVNVNNYANMEALEGPLVKSVATAVGNNVSISVSSPSVD